MKSFLMIAVAFYALGCNPSERPMAHNFDVMLDRQGTHSGMIELFVTADSEISYKISILPDLGEIQQSSDEDLKRLYKGVNKVSVMTSSPGKNRFYMRLLSPDGKILYTELVTFFYKKNNDGLEAEVTMTRPSQGEVIVSVKQNSGVKVDQIWVEGVDDSSLRNGWVDLDFGGSARIKLKKDNLKTSLSYKLRSLYGEETPLSSVRVPSEIIAVQDANTALQNPLK